MAEIKASKQRLEPVLGLTREVHRTTTLLRQMLSGQALQRFARAWSRGRLPQSLEPRITLPATFILREGWESTFITARMPVFLKSDSRTPFHHLKFPCTCCVPHLGEFAVFGVFRV